MRVIAAAYTVLAIAASSRAAVQLATRAGEAPVPYTLSALAAVVYLTLAISVSRPRLRRLALAAAAAELVGVLTVGTAERLSTTNWPDETVWSSYGAGYGWAPLVLPLATIALLTRSRKPSPPPSRRHATPAADAPEADPV
jgi:hypothetical protein